MAPFTFTEAHNETDEKYYDKDEKQDSRNLGSAHGDTTKPEDSGDDGDHEKYRSVVKHDSLLFNASCNCGKSRASRTATHNLSSAKH
jgi:hypothetical protein